MSEHIIREAKKHRIKFIGGTKNFVFEVYSGSSPTTQTVIVHTSCECRFMTRYGIANGVPCSHIVAVLMGITEKGGIPRD